MDENEVILEGEYGEYVEEESSPLGGEESSPTDEEGVSVSDEQILDAIRSVIDANLQNDNEGIDLLDVPVVSPTVTPSVETVDYTSLLNDIKYQQVQTNSSLSTIIEHQEQTIFDKPIVEYNILETSVLLIVVFGLGSVVIGLIRKFTPKLWR